MEIWFYISFIFCLVEIFENANNHEIKLFIHSSAATILCQ